MKSRPRRSLLGPSILVVASLLGALGSGSRGTAHGATAASASASPTAKTGVLTIRGTLGAPVKATAYLYAIAHLEGDEAPTFDLIGDPGPCDLNPMVEKEVEVTATKLNGALVCISIRVLPTPSSLSGSAAPSGSVVRSAAPASASASSAASTAVRTSSSTLTPGALLWTQYDPFPLVDTKINELRGTNGSDVWGVSDDFTPGSAHWDGSHWRSFSTVGYTGGTAGLHLICAASSTDVWIGAWHWNGTGFAQFKPFINDGTKSVEAEAQSTSCALGSAVWSIADNNSTNRSAVNRWDGKSWSLKHELGHTGSNLLVLSNEDVWVYDGASLVHWNGTGWKSVRGIGGGGAKSLWNAAANDLWGVADNGTISRWNGTRWTDVYRPSTDADPIFASIAGASASDVWAVGYDGVIVHWNGSSLTRFDIGIRIDLLSVWVDPGSGDVWIGTKDGRVIRGSKTAASGGFALTAKRRGAPAPAATTTTIATATLSDGERKHSPACLLACEKKGNACAAPCDVALKSCVKACGTRSTSSEIAACAATCQSPARACMVSCKSGVDACVAACPTE